MIVREYIAIVLRHSVCDNLLWQPLETNAKPFLEGPQLGRALKIPLPTGFVMKTEEESRGEAGGEARLVASCWPT